VGPNVRDLDVSTAQGVSSILQNRPGLNSFLPTPSAILPSHATPSVFPNVTLDGSCDHRAIPANEELHRHAAETLTDADARLFGRVTYEIVEAAFRPPEGTGARPDCDRGWLPFLPQLWIGLRRLSSPHDFEGQWDGRHAG
jgi:hypothetical protein